MSTNALLTVTAVFEAGTGVALLAVPSLTAEVLLGEGLSAPPALVVARVTGVALISLAAACWLGKNGERPAQSWLVVGMLIYNLGVPIALLHGRFASALDGYGLWPAIFLHATLGLWCAVCLRPIR